MGPGEPGSGDPKNTKNSTIEANKSLETKGRCRNEAKKYLKTRELLKNGARKAEKLLKTKRITSL